MKGPINAARWYQNPSRVHTQMSSEESRVRINLSAGRRGFVEPTSLAPWALAAPLASSSTIHSTTYAESENNKALVNGQ
jgi:hypothetical protein